ncbi:YwqJ-related putative deaminase [uncultured Kordia sp.]|uniref:YwqJ-related putative deaminase n=1 Tax=uncultured Kordia sp. TaxID=507699 RepID=UPI0026127035|nr:YwqJ-related putative deaminase [uncultured Kordia sp.]
MRKILKILMYPWEKRRKRKEEFNILLKKAKLKLKKHKNTSIILGCLKVFQSDNGKYFIEDEYGNILHDGLTESQAIKQMAKYSDDAKVAGKTLEDHIYDIAYNTKGLAVKISSVSKSALDDLVRNVWNDLLRLKRNKRKGAVSIMEHPKYGTIGGGSIKGLARGILPDHFHPVLKDWLQGVLKKMDDGVIPRSWQHGKCAEAEVLSELLWRIDPSGKMDINKIRKILEGTISKAADLSTNAATRGSFKPACKSCAPMLKYFNILQDINPI